VALSLLKLVEKTRQRNELGRKQIRWLGEIRAAGYLCLCWVYRVSLDSAHETARQQK